MHTKGDNSTGLGTILLSIAAIALAGTVGTVGLMQQAGDFGPKVGDIVAFDPLRQFPRDMKAQIAAESAQAPSAGCLLDVRAMHAEGGSVVIEAKQPGERPSFRVHWAGQHTSDSRDCGSSAELVLDQDDIETLVMAAGGYGAVRQAQGAPLVRSGTSIP